MDQWKSLADFFAMSGRGFYVWWSFGFTFALIMIELLLLRMRSKRAKQTVLNNLK